MWWEDRIVTLDVGDRQLELILTLGAFAMLENKYGSMAQFSDMMQQQTVSVALEACCIMANQARMLRTATTSPDDPGMINVHWMSQNVPPDKIQEITEAVVKAVNLGTKAETTAVSEDDEVDLVLEELEKNA